MLQFDLEDQGQGHKVGMTTNNMLSLNEDFRNSKLASTRTTYNPTEF